MLLWAHQRFQHPMHRSGSHTEPRMISGCRGQGELYVPYTNAMRDDIVVLTITVPQLQEAE